jgi:D-xylose transport system permease protein
MTDTTSTSQADTARASELSAVARFLKATELDTRMLGMIGALLLIWIGLHVISSLRLGVNPLDFDSRTFLTPRNLWNLSVQTSAVAIMASGMVLVIVMRNIDLSVGSAEGVIGMVMGFAQLVQTCRRKRQANPPFHYAEGRCRATASAFVK